MAGRKRIRNFFGLFEPKKKVGTKVFRTYFWGNDPNNADSLHAFRASSLASAKNLVMRKRAQMGDDSIGLFGYNGKEIRIANPSVKKGSWIRATAVRFNRKGSVSIKK